MRKRKPYPTHSQVRQSFDYTPNALRWVQSSERPGHAIDRKADKPDGRSATRRVQIDRKLYDLDLLVWIWHNGDLPDGFIVSHRDGDPDNSSIENLMLEPPHFTMLKQQAVISRVSGLRQALADGLPGDIGQDYYEIDEMLADLKTLASEIAALTTEKETA